jgi:riboflavin kinase / FMN adenylyltransferase
MVVGDDFRYGSKAAGTIESLRCGSRQGLRVEQIAPFVVDGVRVSSTAVRERWSKGIFKARRACWGALPHARSRRRTAGGSAARSAIRPRICVSCDASRRFRASLAVRAYGIEARPMPGVASLGTRPTVNGVEPLLEVHVFDFAGDLYGRMIEVEFVAKLRDEVKFDSLDALMLQMQIDARARAPSCRKVDCG